MKSESDTPRVDEDERATLEPRERAIKMLSELLNPVPETSPRPRASTHAGDRRS